ncbi:hypothetical protein [Streptomyces nigrescens]|uniref:Uncharacterized protein n=1 Tax=Streptomyces nigrescens TaxID=1920 RepID=A0ABY7IZP4_STRNI|nr:hypothetical protein [Streptomyces nigrescens]WAU03800.1 hypothetical protein STRNI_001990 [Streptomyces nigrescens]
MSETTHPVARTFSLVGFDQTAGATTALVRLTSRSPSRMRWSLRKPGGRRRTVRLAPQTFTAGVNEGGFTCRFFDPDEITLELAQPPVRWPSLTGERGVDGECRIG